MVAQVQTPQGWPRGGWPTYIPWSIDRKPGAPDIPDDEFDAGGRLHPKWTVVEGTLATVDPLSTAATGYDLASKPGSLLAQPRNGVGVTRLTQAYTLPDQRSIVMKMRPATVLAGDTNAVWGPIISLTTSPGTDYDTSDNNGLYLIGYRSNGLYSKIHSSGNHYLGVVQLNRSLYLKITRNGLVYTTWMSGDGECWCPVGTGTAANARTKLWLAMASYSTFTGPVPIQEIEWIREGGLGVRPWG